MLLRHVWGNKSADGRGRWVARGLCVSAVGEGTGHMAGHVLATRLY